MSTPRSIAPRSPGDRHLVRRFTDEEMAELCSLARDGRTGPSRALDRLWDLILDAVHGRGVRPQEPWSVQDYSIESDQSAALFDAMISRRRLPPRVVSGFGMMWLCYAPADHVPAASRAH